MSKPLQQTTIPQECGECGRNGEDFAGCERDFCPARRQTTLPPPTPRWRRRLGRYLYGWVRRVYPEMANRHDLHDRSLTAAHRELKAAWRKLDEASHV